MQLLVFTSDSLFSKHSFKWTAPGSFVLLREFLSATVEPGWLSVLRSACTNFKVTLAPTDAFLGQGATGQVFRVYDADEVKTSDIVGTLRVFALKVVDGGQNGEHITSLSREVDLLTRFPTKLPHDLPVWRHLPRSCSDLYISYDSNGHSQLGAAAKFQPVGVSLRDADRSEQLWGEVCRALAALHLAGIYHGDPRLPNIVRLADKELVWIDFRTSNTATTIEFRFDCLILLQSFFGHLPKQNSRFDELATEYTKALDADDLSSLTDWCERAWTILDDAYSYGDKK